MLKKWSALLIVALLLIVPLTLTACGGDDDKDNKQEDTAATAIPLPQTYTDETLGITLQYPEGWVVKADQIGIEVANSQAAFDADPMSAEHLRVGVITSPLESLQVTDLDSAVKMLTDSMVSGGNSSVLDGEVTSLKIGDIDARRMITNDTATGYDQLYLLFLSEDKTQLVIVGGTTVKGQSASVEPYALAIAETVKVTAPAAE